MSIKISEIDYIAEDSADILIPPLTLELRSMANAAGWPSSLIAAIEVAYEDGDLVVSYPEELKEDIENLEYGDINSLPTAVIRPFILRAHLTIQKVLEREAVGSLFVSLGVV